MPAAASVPHVDARLASRDFAVAGLGPQSNFTRFTTTIDAPGSPGTPYRLNFTNTSITFGWAAAAPNGAPVTGHDFIFCTNAGSNNESCAGRADLQATWLHGDAQTSIRTTVAPTHPASVGAACDRPRDPRGDRDPHAQAGSAGPLPL